MSLALIIWSSSVLPKDWTWAAAVPDPGTFSLTFTAPQATPWGSSLQDLIQKVQNLG